MCVCVPERTPLARQQRLSGEQWHWRKGWCWHLYSCCGVKRKGRTSAETKNQIDSAERFPSDDMIERMRQWMMLLIFVHVYGLRALQPSQNMIVCLWMSNMYVYCTIIAVAQNLFFTINQWKVIYLANLASATSMILFISKMHRWTLKQINMVWELHMHNIDGQIFSIDLKYRKYFWRNHITLGENHNYLFTDFYSSFLKV